MQTLFLLGPAGSGKTFRCLAEIRSALEASPDGPPLLLISPKQATYQLERQLLEPGTISGFSRLHILSFERLAKFVFEQLQLPEPRLLDEEGRLMVLRAVLARRRDSLKLFRASSRLNGFARHLSEALRELQREKMTPESIFRLAESIHDVPGLNFKLQDLATLLQEYLAWLEENGLRDSDCLLSGAAQILNENPWPCKFEAVWVDGFAEFSGQELDLLTGISARANRSTLALCLDREPQGRHQRSSQWTKLEKTYLTCRKRITEAIHSEISVELLDGGAERGRYAGNPVLNHLEVSWESPSPFNSESQNDADTMNRALRMVRCANPEAEAVMAAREILRFVRAGGRFREAAVLMRQLDLYHEILFNVFTRYQIPFFLDRREAVSHHPLAELTRSALRTLDRNWEHDDWFGVLKSGLTGIPESLVDLLENEALSNGWKNDIWKKNLVVPENPILSHELNAARKPLMQKFSELGRSLGARPDGPTLANALRNFWLELAVPTTLERWSFFASSGMSPIHQTVWEQMSVWLKNIELAFASHAFTIREWLPIVEAGLSNLSAGVVPPMLDQVLIGAIDRSRNPELRLAILLGLNEGVFPAPPRASVLLTDRDRCELETHGYPLPTARHQIGRERFFAYVMFTRARDRLVVAWSASDSAGNAINESPFLSHFRRQFPLLELEDFKRVSEWPESEHASELVTPMMRNLSFPEFERDKDLVGLQNVPALAELKERLSHFQLVKGSDSLSPPLAVLIYGKELKTSVSRMEQFAACPFKFFVNSGLRAEERVVFEMDVRDQGNFQHEILAEFHESLKASGKKWRDITPEEARKRIAAIALSRTSDFRSGLFQSTEQGKFAARMMSESLQDFVATLVGWMQSQYGFDPVVVEFPFGEPDGAFPAWTLALGDGRKLLLKGRIDRVDLCMEAPGSSKAFCVVIDYKSSDKKLEALLMENGLQLQLPAYLNVLRNWSNPAAVFGVSKLISGGVFYVNLRGQYEKGGNRDVALNDADEDRRKAYMHKGRFSADILGRLDQRLVKERGDQFNFALKKDGTLSASHKDGMSRVDFESMLDQVEASLLEMGEKIYKGAAAVDPYRKGSQTPCDQCDYKSICRIDPWTHQYRQLLKGRRRDESHPLTAPGSH